VRLVLDGSHHGAYEQRIQEVAGRESASDLASALYFVASRSRVARCPRPFSGHTSLALHHRGDSKLLILSHAIHLSPGDSVFGGKPLKWTFRVGDQPPTLGQRLWEADLERKQEFSAGPRVPSQCEMPTDMESASGQLRQAARPLANFAPTVPTDVPRCVHHRWAICNLI